MKKIKTRFEQLKLNQKFTLVILLLVVIPMFIFSMILFQNMEKNSIRQLMAETQEQVTETHNTVEKTVELCNMSTQTFLNNQELSIFLQRLKDQESITTREYLDFNQKNISMMERLVNSNPYLYQICIYAHNNTFPEMIPILYHENRMENLPWANDYISGTWQFDYPDNLRSSTNMNASQHLISLVSSLQNSSGTEIGVIEVAVQMDEVFPLIFQSNSQEWACFVQDDGTVHTAGTDEELCKWEGMKEAILEKAGLDGKPSIEKVKLGGENIILAVQPMKELSGTYVQITSLKSRMGTITKQKYFLIAVMAVIFVALFIIIDKLVKILLKKFYQTMKVIRQVQGDMNVRMEETGSDEMGELGSQINKMLDRIQQLMEENISREVLIKNTEIKALQNQINAHFIYNVLESIKMMAEIDCEYEISDAVTALGELLRYSMKWTSGNVTIRQEIDYIQNYITLMNLRYDFVIGLSVNIRDDIFEQEIPKMSLQPIVENAICHGIEDLDMDATIYIKAVDDGNDFKIEITDSGKGMDEMQLNLLYRKMAGEVEVNGGSGNGIGLKNVQDRIHMQFGPQYGLHFDSKEGCFTKVSIKLPFTQNKKP